MDDWWKMQTLFKLKPLGALVQSSDSAAARFMSFFSHEW